MKILLRAIMVLCVAATLAPSVAWGNASRPIVITATMTPPARWNVEFDEVRARHAEVVLAGYPSGIVEIYPLNASATQRRAKACTFPVTAAGGDGKLNLFAPPATEACAALLAPLRSNQDLELAVSAPGSSELAAISYVGPKSYQGKDPAIVITDNANGVPVWGNSLKLPDHVKLGVDHRCFVLLDDWHTETCNNGPTPMTFSQPTLDVIAARWGRGDTVELIVSAIDADSSTGAWRRVPMVLKAKPKPGGSTPEPDESASLDMRCHVTASLVLDVTDYYLMCVDALEKRTGVVTLYCKGSDPKACHNVGDLLDSGHSFVVRVWRDPEVQELVSLSGAAGYSNIRDPRIDKAAPDSDQPYQLWYFDSRKSGDMDLTVESWKRPKPDEAIAKAVSVTKKYRVRGNYRLVFRFGLGMTWAPGARKLGVETTADGQKYVAVTEGGKYGLFDNEFVVGLSFFPWPVREDSLELRLALGLRLGLVSLGTDGKWFRSLMIGPELAIGPDVSLGIFGGVVPYDRPRDDYQPGTLLAPSVSKVPTGYSVTPAVGVAFNFTPGFLKVFGVDK